MSFDSNPSDFNPQQKVMKVLSLLTSRLGVDYSVDRIRIDVHEICADIEEATSVAVSIEAMYPKSKVVAYLGEPQRSFDWDRHLTIEFTSPYPAVFQDSKFFVLTYKEMQALNALLSKQDRFLDDEILAIQARLRRSLEE